MFIGVAFQGLPEGAPEGDYFSRAIVNCCRAPTTDTAFMWVTSWLSITGRGKANTPTSAEQLTYSARVPVRAHDCGRPADPASAVTPRSCEAQIPRTAHTLLGSVMII